MWELFYLFPRRENLIPANREVLYLRDDNNDYDVDFNDDNNDEEGGLSLTREIHVRGKFHSIAWVVLWRWLTYTNTPKIPS